MFIGYARISTQDQSLTLQEDALKTAGCEKIFTDTASGANINRTGLTDAIAHLRAGDTLIVWRLDRLGRSLAHLIETVTELKNRGIGFRSLTEGIETQSSGGKLVFHLFACLAEFERSVIQERTRAGLAAARLRGRKGGRPRVLKEKDTALARRMAADPAASVSEICRVLGISRATFYRYLAKRTTSAPLSASLPLPAQPAPDVLG